MEVSLVEIMGIIMGVSGLNVGVIMAYIKLGHNQMSKELKQVAECITKKYESGKKEHKRLDQRIDEITKTKC